MKEDNELQLTITKSMTAFAQLTATLTELQSDMKGKVQKKIQ